MALMNPDGQHTLSDTVPIDSALDDHVYADIVPLELKLPRGDLMQGWT